MSKSFENKDIVWAKMRGYPHWPAKVMKAPKGTKPPAHKKFVFFYGTHEHAWIPESELFPYLEFCAKFKKPSNKRGFLAALREVEQLFPAKPKSETTDASHQQVQDPTTSSQSTSGDTTASEKISSASGNQPGSTGSQKASEDSIMDAFFSQESQEGSLETPLPIRKRRALRSLSHEPVKRTRKNNSSSQPPFEQPSTSALSSPDRGGMATRTARSITPHHYQPHPQPQSNSAETTDTTTTTTTGGSQPTLLDYVTPELPKQGENGSTLCSGARNTIETACTSEQVQISNTAIGAMPQQEVDPSVGEEEKTKDMESQAEDVEQSSKITQVKRKVQEDDQSEMKSQDAKSSLSQGEEAKGGEVPLDKSSEVASPHRYSTRRPGRGQGSIVEKLTQSYSARIEQALGSPEIKKKPLPSPKKTPKAKSATPSNANNNKSVTRKSAGRGGRGGRGRGRSRGARAELERQVGGETVVVQQSEQLGDGNEISNEGVDALVPSTSQTKQGDEEKPLEVRVEPKTEPGRRKSARLSKLQTLSTPNEQKSSGKKGKEPQSSSKRKKRSRQASESSLEDHGGEDKGKDGKEGDTEQVVADKDSVEGTQSKMGEPASIPVIRKSSRTSKSPVRDGNVSTVDESASKSEESSASGKRVLRSRQKGAAGSKGKSVPKKIKLEQEIGESLASGSQLSADVLPSEGKSQLSDEKDNLSNDKMKDVSSENKRVLRKRKQTNSSVTNSSKRVAASERKSDSQESQNSAQTSQSKPSSEGSAKASKNNSKTTTDADEAAKMKDDGDGKNEELIVRVPTSVTKMQKESEETEGKSLPREESGAKESDEPPSLASSSSTTDNTGGQSTTVSGGQGAPPTTSTSLQSNSSCSNKDDIQSSSSSGDKTTSEASEMSKSGEKDKVGEVKKIDVSQLPPIIQIRAGMSTVEALRAYNYNIKASLVTDAPNVAKALSTLHDLKELQITVADLEKVPDLVHTVRKLKHYQASSKVIRRAEEVYNKLKGLYMHPKLVVRQPRKKVVGGAGIRKRPPTMAEVLNSQPKKRTQKSKSQTSSKPNPSTSSSSSAPSAVNKNQTPPPSNEASGITDVISKKPTNAQIKAAHAPLVPQLPDKGTSTNKDNDIGDRGDQEAPSSQPAEERETVPPSTSQTTPTTDVSSVATVPSKDNIPTTSTVQAEGSVSRQADMDTGSLEAPSVSIQPSLHSSAAATTVASLTVPESKQSGKQSVETISHNTVSLTVSESQPNSGQSVEIISRNTTSVTVSQPSSDLQPVERDSGDTTTVALSDAQQNSNNHQSIEIASGEATSLTVSETQSSNVHQSVESVGSDKASDVETGQSSNSLQTSGLASTSDVAVDKREQSPAPSQIDVGTCNSSSISTTGSDEQPTSTSSTVRTDSSTCSSASEVASVTAQSSHTSSSILEAGTVVPSAETPVADENQGSSTSLCQTGQASSATAAEVDFPVNAEVESLLQSHTISSQEDETKGSGPDKDQIVPSTLQD